MQRKARSSLKNYKTNTKNYVQKDRDSIALEWNLYL